MELEKILDSVIEFNQLLSDTVPTTAEDYKLKKGGIYCRAVVLDCVAAPNKVITYCKAKS